MSPPPVVRFDPSRFRWKGVTARPYKVPDESGQPWRGVQRVVLVGRGAPVAFHLRYFEIAPGGYSSFERHRHAHAVLVVRGRGRVRMGDRIHRVGPMDFIFVPPGIAHQFRAGREPFGFVCPVDAVRDRPQPVSAARTRRRRSARRTGRRAGRSPGRSLAR